MSFNEKQLSEEIKSDYQRLLEIIATNSLDTEQAKTLTNNTLSKIGLFEKTEDVNFAIRAYLKAYETLATDSPDNFPQIAKKIPDNFENMLKVQSEGNFHGKGQKINEDTFLANVQILTENLIDIENFSSSYSKTGLPDNPKVKLAYKLFLEQMDDAFNSIKQAMSGSLGEISDNQAKAIKEFEKERNNTIVSSVKMAKIMADTEDKVKAIIPFAVTLDRIGAEDALDELKEELDEYENYLIESTLWGVSNIVDNIHANMAKEYMLEKAVVPLKKSQKDDKKDAETKFIPIKDAMNYYRQANDEEGVVAVLDAAVVAMNNDGQAEFISLSQIFSTIEENPAYRLEIVSNMEDLPLPISFADLTTQMVIDKILIAEKIVSVVSQKHLDDPATKLYAQILEPLEEKLIKHYVQVITNMETSEDMQACAELMVANAITTLNSSMIIPDSLASIANNPNYYMTVGFDGDSQKDNIDGLVAVDTVKPYIEQAIVDFEAIYNIFTQANGDGRTTTPLFANTDSKLQENFMQRINLADYKLAQLLPTLEGNLKQQIAQEEALKAKKEAKQSHNKPK